MAQRRILDLTEASAPKDDMYVPVDHGNDGTQRISAGALLANKANVDGYYEGLTAGNAIGLVTDSVVTDKEPYNFRSLAHLPVGKFCYDTIVGGSVVWNQLFKNGNFADTTSWRLYTPSNGTVSMSNNIATIEYSVEGVGGYAFGLLYVGGNITLQTGHKYLFSCKAKPSFETKFELELGTGLGVLANATPNQWNDIAFVGMRPSWNSGTTVEFKPTLSTIAVGDTLQIKNCVFIDLTAAVTPLIADYIYSLETANAGDGVAYFKKYFPKEYHEYCEPHFEHVQTSAKETVGFNLLNPANTIKGGYNVAVGSVLSSGQATATLTGDNPVNVSITSGWQAVSFVSDKLLPNTVYYINCVTDATTPSKVRLTAYLVDENYSVVRNYGPYTTTHTYHSTVTTADENGLRFVLYVSSESANTITLADLCLNIHGDRDGEYEAYQKRTYPIEAKVLRGVLKLDSANRPYFDGDVMRSDGSGEERYEEVDLGEQSWTYVTTSDRNYFYTGIATKTRLASDMICSAYPYGGSKLDSEMGNAADLTVYSETGYKSVKIKDSRYTDAATFKTAMSGKKLVFLKETPEPFAAEPYQYPMVVDPLGTEEFIDYGVEEGTRDVAIPVGHESEYQEDMVAKLETLPHLADSDGSFYIVQADGQMALAPNTSPGRLDTLEVRVPAPPTTDGTYTLKAVVADGNPTFSWVSE